MPDTGDRPPARTLAAVRASAPVAGRQPVRPHATLATPCGWVGNGVGTHTRAGPCPVGQALRRGSDGCLEPLRKGSLP
jgi:hypothetical protein